MTTRSGQWTHQEDLTVMCLACEWWGNVEATIDETRHDCWWMCPNCTTETVDEWRTT